LPYLIGGYMGDYFKNRFLDLIETIYDKDDTGGESGSSAAAIMKELVENGYMDQFMEMLFHVSKTSFAIVYSLFGPDSMADFVQSVLDSLARDIAEFDV